MQSATADVNNSLLREQLKTLLRGGDAHIHFDDLIRDFPVDRINQLLDGVPYTAWQVLEHMRIAQWDIIEFSRNPDHVSPHFPKGYWPPPGDATSVMWQDAITAFTKDLEGMLELLSDEDLFKPFAHGDGQTLLREVLILADHNAYHIGVLTLMKRSLTTPGRNVQS
jgi:hypothetical protein